MFSESQEKAIAFNRGPAIVIAGPGSGKTTVITHRVKNLIEKNHVNPEKILVVTFTRAATENMRLRFKSLMAGRTLPVSFGTFHSIFFRILRNEKNYRSDSLLSDLEKMEIIKEIIIRLKIDVSSKNDFIRNMLDEISKAKGNLERIEEHEPVFCDKEMFLKVYSEYEKEKAFVNKVDYEDMLRLCLKLFKEKPKVLEKWQDVFEYILVDEFQDINKLQFEIVKMLSKPQNNIFIVGDDDQSIYGFRGSCPELMFEFKEYYHSASEIFLTNNYRSTKEIVKAAANLIKNNKARFEKDIVAMSESGMKPDIRVYKSQKDEIYSVCEMVKEYIKKGIEPKEIAVLVRNNNIIPIIKTIFEEKDISVLSKVKKENFSSSFVFKDIIDYLKCAHSWEGTSTHNYESFLNILNKPTRLISREVAIEQDMDIEKIKRVYLHNREIVRNIDDFVFHMKMIKSLTPYGAVNYIKNVVGYEKYLRQYANNKSISLKKLFNELDRIQTESNSFKSIGEWLDYVDNTQADDNKSDLEKNSAKKVNIMTMHGSKGLEFKVVFILNVNQGIIPSSRAAREQDFEEERRVFYVAMTRAKEYLHIFLMGENLGFPVEPSMFLNEIIN